MICGFPVETQGFSENMIAFHPFVYRGVAYGGTDPDAVRDLQWARPLDRDIDFLLHHDEEGIARDGSTAQAPAFNGMSGCSLWGFVPGTVPGGLRVFAVQTGVVRHRWIRFTLWGVVARVIHDTWPELRSALIEHFGDVFSESLDSD